MAALLARHLRSTWLGMTTLTPRDATEIGTKCSAPTICINALKTPSRSVVHWSKCNKDAGRSWDVNQMMGVANQGVTSLGGLMGYLN